MIEKEIGCSQYESTGNRGTQKKIQFKNQVENDRKQQKNFLLAFMI